MVGTIFCTASTLKAVLCYIDPETTPKIAYDRDDLAKPLADKLKQAVGDKDGSQDAAITFGHDDAELGEQFLHICDNISRIFGNIARLL